MPASKLHDVSAWFEEVSKEFSAEIISNSCKDCSHKLEKVIDHNMETECDTKYRLEVDYWAIFCETLKLNNTDKSNIAKNEFSD